MSEDFEALYAELKSTRDTYNKHGEGAVSCASVAKLLDGIIRFHTPHHTHTCQQCDSVVTEHCDCDTPEKNIWCSATCHAAFEL